MQLGEVKSATEKVARRRVGRGIGSGLEKHLVEDIKDKKQDLAVV